MILIFNISSYICKKSAQNIIKHLLWYLICSYIALDSELIFLKDLSAWIFLSIHFFKTFFWLCRVGHHQEWTPEWWIKLWQIVGAHIFVMYHISHTPLGFQIMIQIPTQIQTQIEEGHICHEKLYISYLQLTARHSNDKPSIILNIVNTCIYISHILSNSFFSDNVEWSSDRAVNCKQVSPIPNN